MTRFLLELSNNCQELVSPMKTSSTTNPPHFAPCRTSWSVTQGAFLVVLAITGCGGRSTQSAGPDSSSHWLSSCTTDDECGDAQCLCGRCTTSCDVRQDCKVLAETFGGFTVQCAPVTSCDSEPLCQVICSSDDDCPSGASHCQAGSCVEEMGLDGGDSRPTSTISTDAGDSSFTAMMSTDTADTGWITTSGAGPSSDDTGSSPPFDQCHAGFSETPIVLGAASAGFGRFARNDSFVFGVSRGSGGQGYQVTTVTLDSGETVVSETLWPDLSSDMLELAVSGNTLAFVTMPSEGDTLRQTCSVALYDTLQHTSIAAPTRFSDKPAGDSIQNEVQWCGVAAIADGFVLAWNQFTSSTSDEQALFAQRIAWNGTPVGERIVLAEGDKRTSQVSTASDGIRALFAVTGDTSTQFTFVESESVVPLPVEDAVNQVIGAEPPTLQFVPGGFLVQDSGELALVGTDGMLKAGPIPAVRGLIAPFEQGYVVVERDSESGFLVSRRLDSSLHERGSASGVTADRDTSASALLASSDGKDVRLVFREQEQQLIGTLGCLQAPNPIGPQPCRQTSEPSGAVPPLELECDSDVCYFTLRMAAPTLGILGYSVAEGDVSPVDAEQAEVIATEALSGFEEAQYSEFDTVVGPEAGLFTVSAEPLDFGGFALVGAESGTVVAAGGIVWSGSGSYWLPSEWEPSSVIECGSVPASPAATYLSPAESISGEEVTGLPTASEALGVALRSNLAARAATFSEFDAFVYLYTPGVGSLSLDIVEYVVVFTARGAAP